MELPASPARSFLAFSQGPTSNLEDKASLSQDTTPAISALFGLGPSRKLHPYQQAPLGGQRCRRKLSMPTRLVQKSATHSEDKYGSHDQGYLGDPRTAVATSRHLLTPLMIGAFARAN